MGDAKDGGAQAPATINSYFADLGQRYGVDSDGVPKLPGLSQNLTKEWMARVTSLDTAMQDAAARGTDVAERSRASGAAQFFGTALDDLKKLPTQLDDAGKPPAKSVKNPDPQPPTPEELAKKAEALVQPHDYGDKLIASYDRSMAGPNDKDRRTIESKAFEQYKENAQDRDPRISFGMTRIMGDQGVKDYIALDDRYQAVDRVNKFLNYGDRRGSEREMMDHGIGAHNSTLARQMDDFYGSSHNTVRDDGFDAKAKTQETLNNIDARLTEIQTRDGISNDGSFQLPGLSAAQSKEWLARCERMDSALQEAKSQGGPGKVSRDAAQAMGPVKADLDKLVAMPKALKALESSNLSQEQRSAEVERMLSQYGQMDKDVAGFEKGLQTKRGFMDRIGDAFDRMKNAITPGSKKEPAQEQPAPAVQTPAPRAAAPAKAAAPDAPGHGVDGPAHDDAKTPAHTPPAQTPAQHAVAQTPAAPAQNGQSHLTIQSGEQGHEMNKGAGFMAMGTVDEIKHVGNTVEIDYTVGGHHQAIKIDESKDKASHALGDAAEHLKPGEAFKMSIGRDRTGNEIAQLDDRSTGHTVQVDRAGHVEEKNQTPQLERARSDRGGR